VSNFFANLKLDCWYKALIYAGAALFLFSLFAETKGINNGQLELLSAGIFFVGLGEWKNWKVESWFKPSNAYTGPAALIRAPIRVPDAIGIGLESIGGLLFVAGLASLVGPLL
jgi:hypothetical protein